jgi:hypothetical protein
LNAGAIPSDATNMPPSADADSPMKESATVPVHVRSAVLFFRKIEAVIGALFAFLVGFVFLVLGADIVYLARLDIEFYWLLPVYLAIAACEVIFLYSLKEALEAPDYPFAPWFALKRRRLPIILRPAAAVWWLSHFLVGIAGAILLQSIAFKNEHGWHAHVTHGLIFVIVSFTVAYSANLYALLALSAVGFGEPAIRLIWRCRLFVDLGIAVAVAFVPPVLARV